MIWKRAALITLVTMTGLALQTSLFRTGTLAGTKPALLLLVTIAVAVGEGTGPGTVTGFVAGLATDLLTPRAVGVTALVFTVIGYTSGRIRAQVAAPTVWLPVVMVFGGTLFGQLAYAGVSAVFGDIVAPAGTVFRHASLSALYNALLTPFLFPLVRALGRRLRPTGTTMEGPTIKVTT